MVPVFAEIQQNGIIMECAQIAMFYAVHAWMELQIAAVPASIR
jgi:hypothetical protein